MAALQGLEAKNDGPVLEIGVLQGLVANIVNFQKKRWQEGYQSELLE